VVVVQGVRIWSGFTASEDGALREVTNLCGLTLGDQVGVTEDLGGAAAGADRQEVAHKPQHLRLVSGHGSLR
jgi:ferritin-like protein